MPGRSRKTSRLTTSSTSAQGPAPGGRPSLDVDGDEVGLLAGLQRADDGVEPERLGATERARGAASRAGPAAEGSRRVERVAAVLLVEALAHLGDDRELRRPGHVRAEADADAGGPIAREGHDPAADEHVADGAVGDGRARLHEPLDLALGEVDGVREEGSGPQATGAVVDVEVVAGLGEQLGDRGDLAAVLGDVRLPRGAVVVRQGGRLAQQVGAAADREAGREGVAEATVGGAVPALAELGRLAQARLEALRGGQALVVAEAIHHDLAERGADAVRLRGPEAGIQAVGPDGAVARERGRAGGGHRPVDLRGEQLGRRHVEVVLQGEDVALQPGEQVHAGPETGGGHLGQVDVRVDEPGHDDQRAQVR